MAGLTPSDVIWIGHGCTCRLQPHVLGQPPPRGFRGLLVDLAAMRVTDSHPDAGRYRQGGAEIPVNSIDLHMHVYSPDWDLAVVGIVGVQAGVDDAIHHSWSIA